MVTADCHRDMAGPQLSSNNIIIPISDGLLQLQCTGNVKHWIKLVPLVVGCVNAMQLLKINFSLANSSTQ